MNILFVHQSFPGQYRHIIKALAERNQGVMIALGIEAPSEPIPKNLHYVRYQLSRGSSQQIHPWCQDYESKVIRGDACARAALTLKQKGFVPDIICAHPGWGEALFLKDVWPNCPILSYQEFYYQAEGFDTGFDHEFFDEASELTRLETHSRIRAKNANTLLNLQESDWCITPTAFQKSTFPHEWHRKISVIHDGIDTDIANPRRQAKAITFGETKLGEHSKIVTFVNRRIEPYRGAHTFIRSVPQIQAENPDCHVIVVGATKGTSYGSACPHGEWREWILEPLESKIDQKRIHFTGQLPYGNYLDLMRISTVHVYLTYPFILSWSLLEAMSFGRAIVGSNTAPVTELIEHEHNGLIVDFFSPKEVASAVSRLLKDREERDVLGDRARKEIEAKYSIEKCLPRQLSLIQRVSNKSLA